MGVPDWIPGTWLPSDADHPVRPDWPVVRHLTFTELHAMELGVAFAVFLYVAVTIEKLAESWPVVLYVGRVLFSERRAKGGTTKCDHPVGIHDITHDPWYFTTTTLVSLGLLVGTVGWPL